MAKRNYNLRYLSLFEDDLSEIVEYITFKLKNPQAASDLVNEVEKSIIDRLECLESFESYQSYQDRKYPYYRIYVKNFEIYYVVIDNDEMKIMEVRRILYNKRDKRKLV